MFDERYRQFSGRRNGSGLARHSTLAGGSTLPELRRDDGTMSSMVAHWRVDASLQGAERPLASWEGR